jgi:hypothetical protein
MALNSPNRFLIASPEPHVCVWFPTFLPRPLVAPLCRLVGKCPYVGKRLLSPRELRSMVTAVCADHTISGRASNQQARGLAGKVFHALRPTSVALFAHVCDHHVVRAVR